VRRRVLAAHPRPVAVELLGDQDREPGPDALAHLGVREHDRHRVVRADAQERVRRRRRRRTLRARYAAHDPRNVKTQDEPAGRLQEAAPRDRHLPPRCRRAATWIASRTRWYVPQRQTLPDIAASMSSSLGSDCFASSATAVMIWPDWQ